MAYAYQTPEPPPENKKPISWSVYLLLAILTLIASLPFIVVCVIYLYAIVNGLILPGIYVGEIHLGWLTPHKAAAELNRSWNDERMLTISDQTGTWQSLPADFGLHLNTDQTITTAYQAGRSIDGLDEMMQILITGSCSITPVVEFFPETARTSLEKIAPLVDVPPQEASVTFENARWLSSPGISGRILDIDQTILHTAINTSLIFTSGYLPLNTRTADPAVLNVSQIASALDGSFASNLVLQAYDPITDESITWPLPGEALAKWIELDSSAAESEIHLKPQAVSAYLAEWQKTNLEPQRSLQEISDLEAALAAWKNGSPVTVFINHAPTEYNVQSGDRLVSIGIKTGMPYWKILEANPNLDSEHLLTGQTLTIPSRNELLPLPVVMGKRIVVSISEQKLRTYENGQQRHEYVVSTGIDSSPTHPGVFQVQTHEMDAYASVWDLHMPFFLGIYEGWPGFMNGIHGLPTLSSGRRLWADVLGTRASYGCIILDLPAAEALYNWAEDGVVTEINP